MESKPKNPRYVSLDHWRGVACLLVVALHSIYFFLYDCPINSDWSRTTVACIRRFWIGVPIFFVISGYCISASIDARRRKGGSFGSYFYRRFLRIYPPYWLFLATATALLAWAEFNTSWQLETHGNTNPPSKSVPLDWIGMVTLTETWLPPLLGTSPTPVMGHIWTLCYEEQFYAVAGLILLAAPRRMFLFMYGITIATIIAWTAIARLGLAIEGFFFNGLWIAFATGAWVYYVRNYARGLAGPLLAAAPVVAWVVRHPQELLVNDIVYSQTAMLFSAIVFAGLIAALSRFDSQISSIAHCSIR